MTSDALLDGDNGALRQFVSVLAAPPVYSSQALAYLRQELITIEEAAETLRCSQADVLQRIEDGELLAVSIAAETMLVARRRISRIADLEAGRRPAHSPERRR
jgi:hypothetical protein